MRIVEELVEIWLNEVCDTKQGQEECSEVKDDDDDDWGYLYNVEPYLQLF